MAKCPDTFESPYADMSDSEAKEIKQKMAPYCGPEVKNFSRPEVFLLIHVKLF